MSAEEWRPIPSWEGLYDASNTGRIRSHHRGGKIKVPTVTYDGYELVFLHGPQGRHGHNVHRLVCAAFHGAPAPGMEAAHLDGNRRNNIPSNLAWATRHENLSHMDIHGTRRRGSDHPSAKLTEDVVEQVWFAQGSAKEVSALFGISSATVADIRCGKRWRHVTGKMHTPKRHPHWSNIPREITQVFRDAYNAGKRGAELGAVIGVGRNTAWKMCKRLAAEKPHSE